jgi:hypothetical protein
VWAFDTGRRDNAADGVKAAGVAQVTRLLYMITDAR